MSRRLPNYLRAHRKTAGLSQRELAFLLGCGDGAKICRYEHGAQQPSLESVLAYEAVFGAPARELFAGVFEKVEERIQERAQSLARKLSAAKPTPRTSHKVALLSRISSGPGSGSERTP